MPRVEFEIESEVPPDQVLAGLTDFTARRPRIWPGLNPKEYVVYQVGDTWAVVREGNGGAVWARERYDWSQPGTVTWTVEESGFCQPGSFVRTHVTPRDGGSRIKVTWERHPKGVLGAIMAIAIPLARGAPVRSSLQAGLDRIRHGALRENLPA